MKSKYKLVTQITFAKWMKQFRKENSDRGIFARWFISNVGLQVHYVIAQNIVLEQMTQQGCSKFLFDVFELCWDEFCALPNAYFPQQHYVSEKLNYFKK